MSYNKIKVGLGRFGGKIYLTTDEITYGNSGVDVYILKSLIESGMFEITVGTEMSGLMPGGGDTLEERCRKGEVPDYVKQIKIDYTNPDVFKDVDLIWIMSGSDNMRFSTNNSDKKIPNNMDLFAKIRRANSNTNIIYTQMDPVAPFYYTGELFNPIVSFFGITAREMLSRNIYILAGGKKTSSTMERYKQYGWCDAINILTSPYDVHFIATGQLMDFSYDITDNYINRIYFPGKDRIKGSRIDTIHSLAKLTPDNWDILLTGKWKAADFNNNKIKYGAHVCNGEYIPEYGEPVINSTQWVGRVPYRNLLEFYNKSYCTVYIGNSMYTDNEMISRRFIDSATAGCLSLIWHEDYKLFIDILGEELLYELILTPNNANSKFNMSCEKRRNLIECTRSYLLRFIDNTKYSVLDIFTGAAETVNGINLDERLNDFLKNYKLWLEKYHKPKNDAEAIKYRFNRVIEVNNDVEKIRGEGYTTSKTLLKWLGDTSEDSTSKLFGLNDIDIIKYYVNCEIKE